MKIKLELFAGGDHHPPTKEDMQRNIDAIKRAIKGRKLVVDDMLLIDTEYILRKIQDQLPEKE